MLEKNEVFHWGSKELALIFIKCRNLFSKVFQESHFLFRDTKNDPPKHLLVNETFREYKLKTIGELGIFIKIEIRYQKNLNFLYERVLFSIWKIIVFAMLKIKKSVIQI
jgi:hypothetical protein